MFSNKTRSLLTSTLMMISLLLIIISIAQAECVDNDGDYFTPFEGYSTWPCISGDCNDNDPDINPGLPELCDDSIDNNCNDLTDGEDPACEGIYCLDNDEDGFNNQSGFSTYSGLFGYCTWPEDCDDNDDAVNPGASEICDDVIDNDCDWNIDCLDSDCTVDPACLTCTDVDEDGYATEGGLCGPVDCNDSDDAVNPGAVESCSDDVDNDCDNQVDCGDADCASDPACNCLPEVCDDGIDNDCDSKVDCSDKKDCRTDPAC